jgi:3-hydroxyacyl-CoA dehydrogenase/enoyl-CoA hydratase/3-hydroxybutyryl-CoA epimerase
VDNAKYLDMAMVMGTGFPAFRGGLMRYADSLGIQNIVEKLNKFSEVYGERFRPSELLFEMAKEGEKFYE